MNGFLRHRVAAGPLANEETLRPACVSQNALADERVVQHEVGATQPRDRCARQQARIPGPGTDERHMSRYNHESSGPLSQGTAGLLPSMP